MQIELTGTEIETIVREYLKDRVEAVNWQCPIWNADGSEASEVSLLMDCELRDIRDAE